MLSRSDVLKNFKSILKINRTYIYEHHFYESVEDASLYKVFI